MRRSWQFDTVIFAALVMLATIPARADDEPAIPPAGAVTPLEVYDVHLAIDLPIIAIGGVAGLLRSYLVTHQVTQRCPCSVDEINSIDRRAVGYHSDAAALTSDITVGLVLGLPPLVDLWILGLHRPFGEDLLVLTETVMVSTLFQQVANFGYQRPRPRTYEGIASNVHDGEGYLSFLAGHVATTTAALATASYTLRRRYGEHVWPWVVTGLVSTSVATERVLAGYHFPSDVAVGAALGLAVGLAVPWLHARHPDVQLAVVPAANGYKLSLLGAF